ncbi:phage/plasmid primase, P4 family [Falsiroseomonas sp.]|uniref:phage/plasmid primase, P4 family n=1 Tax=Falsiroseomonas sp. TaxID=2870721 RepID=UPI0035613D20
MTDDIEAVHVLRANLWRHGFRPVAVCNPDDPGNSPGKRPVGHAWQERARRDPPEAAAIAPPSASALNTGILCDRLRAVDVDCEREGIVAEICRRAETRFGVGLTRKRVNSARVLLLFRAAAITGPMPGKRSLQGTHGAVEVLGKGQQFVAFGRHHSGAVLEWEPLGPDQVPVHALPAITEEQLTAFLAEDVAPLIGADPAKTAAPVLREQAANASDVVVDLDTPAALQMARDRITATPGAVRGEQSDKAFKLACAVRDFGVSEGEACVLLQEWADRCSPPIMPDDLARRIGNAYRHAQNAAGARHPAVAFAGVTVDTLPSPAAAPPPPEMRAAAVTEEALAQRFTAREGGRMRYVAPWSKWFRWDGARWKQEDTLHAFDISRAICREEASRCGDSGDLAALSRASTVSAVERLARADRKHAATVEQWDADAWLLNTPAGIVDLRTGETAQHDPAASLTKITAAAPDGECPTWMRFLDRITGGDAELQGFLARIAGYALTGSTREHALFFLYGTGGNGKGVFLNTLAAVLGDYAMTAGMETFTASKAERHLTELARLRGARMVTSQETEAERAWAESRIKALTGGDPVTANFMRQDHFTYVPQFKLFIAGNHKPGLRAVDEAMRRRLHMIPFAVTIPAAERDHALADKLRGEAGGILAWALRGCLDWQRIGLAPPAAVVDATAAYLSDEDALGQWLEACCDVAKDRFALSGTLYRSWCEWARAAGEPHGTRRSFAQAMQARGFRSGRQGGAGDRGFHGLEIRQSAFVPPAPEMRVGGEGGA